MTGYESKKKAAQAKLDSMGREALKLALDLATMHHTDDGYAELRSKVRQFAKEALAQPAQEPVAWYHNDFGVVELSRIPRAGWKPLPIQPAQEPESVTYKEVQDSMNALEKGDLRQQVIAEELGQRKLYTTPPQRTWVSFTDEEVDQFHNWKNKTWSTNELVRHVEAALRSKNT